MSDTVKLIIEIPKQAYELCKTLKSDSDDGIIGICAVNAIGNGTPLDDVKAEIEQTIKDYDKSGDYRRVRGLWMALEILNNIGKESEEV